MLSAIYGEQFFHDCYSPLGEVIVKLNINVENTSQNQTDCHALYLVPSSCYNAFSKGVNNFLWKGNGPSGPDK